MDRKTTGNKNSGISKPGNLTAGTVHAMRQVPAHEMDRKTTGNKNSGISKPGNLTAGTVHAMRQVPAHEMDRKTTGNKNSGISKPGNLTAGTVHAVRQVPRHTDQSLASHSQHNDDSQYTHHDNDDHSHLNSHDSDDHSHHDENLHSHHGDDHSHHDENLFSYHGDDHSHHDDNLQSHHRDDSQSSSMATPGSHSHAHSFAHWIHEVVLEEDTSYEHDHASVNLAEVVSPTATPDGSKAETENARLRTKVGPLWTVEGDNSTSSSISTIESGKKLLPTASLGSDQTKMSASVPNLVPMLDKIIVQPQCDRKGSLQPAGGC